MNLSKLKRSRKAMGQWLKAERLNPDPDDKAPPEVYRSVLSARNNCRRQIQAIKMRRRDKRGNKK